MLDGHKQIWNFISKNKPVADRSIDLSLELFLGYLKNGTDWYSADEYAEISDTAISWNDVTVTVSLDNTVLYSGSPTDSPVLTHTFQDSDQAQFKVFQIKIQGLDHVHNAPWPITGEPGVVALRVRGHIDHLPLQLLMSKFAKYIVDQDGSTNVATEIMGQNGSQTLVIQTPFYAWLHQHRESFIWELTYPNGYTP
jgi:hypothetical protein